MIIIILYLFFASEIIAKLSIAIEEVAFPDKKRNNKASFLPSFVTSLIFFCLRSFLLFLLQRDIQSDKKNLTLHLHWTDIRNHTTAIFGKRLFLTLVRELFHTKAINIKNHNDTVFKMVKALLKV